MDQTQSDWMSTTKRITWQYFVWCSAWGRGQGAGRVGGGGAGVTACLLNFAISTEHLVTKIFKHGLPASCRQGQCVGDHWERGAASHTVGSSHALVALSCTIAPTITVTQSAILHLYIALQRH